MRGFKLECLICGKIFSVDKGLQFCDECWSTLENGKIPDINFKNYFSNRLEDKLTEIDTLLFNIQDNFFLWYLKGHLEHELGMTKKALRSINNTISLKDDFGDAWIRLGLIYSDMHQDTEAMENFKRGLEFTLIDPTNLMDAGISLQASNNPKIASRFFKRTLDLNPDEDRAIVSLGKVYHQMERLDEAESVLEGGVERFPHNEEILRALAQLYIGKDEMQKAQEMYGFILDQHPMDFEALLAMAEINLKSGHLTESIKFYKAVRELDLHISWSGVYKFIIKNLLEILELNKNKPSYKDSLKKEYQNVNLFLENLDKKSQTTSTPDLLEDIENLVRVLSNQEKKLREESIQFEDLLNAYSVEDSFQRHLKSKVDTLKSLIDEMRLYDAKQITLELSPFLSGLNKVDENTEKELKNNIISRMEEFEKLGLDIKELRARLEKVDDLEKEGNLEGATFILKELDISLEESWVEEGKNYREKKYQEMKDLLERAHNNFDASYLYKMAEDFRHSTRKPSEILEAQDEFMERYAKESSAHYSRETERLYQEIKYKLMLMEKDGYEVMELFEKLQELKSERKNLTPMKAFSRASELHKEVNEKEAQHNLKVVRRSLDQVEELMERIDYLGLENILAIHVKPVLKVIRRALENDNLHLADILTNELQDNMMDILISNYPEPLRNIFMETEGMVLRLRGLGVERAEWIDDMEVLKDTTSDASGENVREAIIKLSEIKMGIEEFIEKDLQKELSRKVQDISGLLEECGSLGLMHGDFVKKLQGVEEMMGEAPSLDLLEKAYQMEKDVEMRIRSQLTDITSSMISDLKERIDSMVERGWDHRKSMELLAGINRAEILLENNNHREAHEEAKGFKEKIDSLVNELRMKEMKDQIASISRHIKRASGMSLDVKSFKKRLGEISVLDPEELPAWSQEVDVLHKEVRRTVQKRMKELLKEKERVYSEFIEENESIIEKDLIERMNGLIEVWKDNFDEGDIDKIASTFEKSEELLQEAKSAARERALLVRTSEIIDLCINIDDENAKEIVAQAQSIASDIKKGRSENAKEEIDELSGEMKSILTIHQLRLVENLMSRIRELDDLSKEVREGVSDDTYRDKLSEIDEEIEGLMDQTISLHRGGDIKTIENISNRLDELKETMVDTENEYRANEKMKLLERFNETGDLKSSKELEKGFKRLGEDYSNREWNSFFRDWERLESKLKKISRTKGPDAAISKLIRGISTDIGQRSREIITPKVSKQESSRVYKEKETQAVNMNGIGKITSEAFMKSKKMEYEKEVPLEEVTEDVEVNSEDKGEEDKSKENPEGDSFENSITGVARLIAGSRMEDLKRVDSEAISVLNGGDDSDIVINQIAKAEGEHTDAINDLMEDFLDIDLTFPGSASSKEINSMKKRLETLFNRMPNLYQLNEARHLYREGVKDLEKGKEAKAKREFKMAVSNAIKVCKIHLDIGKTLFRVGKNLKGAKSGGYDVSEVGKLYKRAVEEYKVGKLVQCAKTIRKIKEELKQDLS